MDLPSKISTLAALALALTACFDSDEFRSDASGESSVNGGETVTPYSDESDEGSDDNWTAEETGPFENTCRDAIDCLITCQSILIFNPQPEPDLSCFLECDKSLSTEEAYLLIKLAECIGNKCADEGDCGGDATDTDCLTCIAANGGDEQPPGCIDEAAACQ